MPRKKSYILTQTAAHDFRRAKAWSLSRWGTRLTRQYFKDLHDGANYIASNHSALRERNDLTGDTGLGIHAVREHYIIYVPIEKQEIVIVALIRQSRDVPALLRAYHYRIRQELDDFRDKN